MFVLVSCVCWDERGEGRIRKELFSETAIIGSCV